MWGQHYVNKGSVLGLGGVACPHSPGQVIGLYIGMIKLQLPGYIIIAAQPNVDVFNLLKYEFDPSDGPSIYLRNKFKGL